MAVMGLVMGLAGAGVSTYVIRLSVEARWWPMVVLMATCLLTNLLTIGVSVWMLQRF